MPEPRLTVHEQFRRNSQREKWKTHGKHSVVMFVVHTVNVETIFHLDQTYKMRAILLNMRINIIAAKNEVNAEWEGERQRQRARDADYVSSSVFCFSFSLCWMNVCARRCTFFNWKSIVIVHRHFVCLLRHMHWQSVTGNLEVVYVEYNSPQ